MDINTPNKKKTTKKIVQNEPDPNVDVLYDSTKTKKWTKNKTSKKILNSVVLLPQASSLSVTSNLCFDLLACNLFQLVNGKWL